ncbi:MAG: hypothetical protein QXZ20_01245 [Candidatus Aenigmatarchaeota archaeon]
MEKDFSIFNIKLAILEILFHKKNLNKDNLIGNTYKKGELEYYFHKSLSEQERNFIDKIIKEMENEELISYKSKGVFISGIDKTLEITEKGKTVLENRALDEIDMSLRTISPKFADKRQEIKHIFLLYSIIDIKIVRKLLSDGIELLENVLNYIAPIEEIHQQPDFVPSPDAPSGVTRKEQIKYIFRKHFNNVFLDDIEIIDNAWKNLEFIFKKYIENNDFPFCEMEKDIGETITIIEFILAKILP